MQRVFIHLSEPYLFSHNSPSVTQSDLEVEAIVQFINKKLKDHQPEIRPLKIIGYNVSASNSQSILLIHDVQVALDRNFYKFLLD